MKTLTIFFDDPIMNILAALVIIVIVLIGGKYVAGWFYQIDEHIKLMETMIELQKEQLKFFKDKFGEPQPQKADPKFKELLNEDKNIQTAKADPDFKKWLDEQKNIQNP